MQAPARAEEIEPGLRVVRAPNPSPMTFTGTNTWIVGARSVALIDPGPDLPAHFDAIRASLAGRTVAAILVTHAHRDHSTLAPRLARETGAPIYAAGDMTGRRRPIMAELAAAGLVGGGEGVDRAFAPDHVLEDGGEVCGPGWRLAALATPGHTSDHLAFTQGDRVFTGDHVMGWASSLVSPPDGDLRAFLASCHRLKAVQARRFFPGHGDPVDAPAARLDWLIAHRERRTAQILAALAAGPATPAALTRAIYTDIDAGLLPAAERNVLAHLIALSEDARVAPRGALSATVEFDLA
ncbi:MAG: MBL fold metallo-hydrolase [Pseudomonadota bacterium]